MNLVLLCTIVYKYILICRHDTHELLCWNLADNIYYHSGCKEFYHSVSFLVVSYLRERLVISRNFCTCVTYLLPRNPHIPQLPQLISWGSKSFRSHLRLRKRFSPGSIKRSISPPTVFLTQFISLSMSY